MVTTGTLTLGKTDKPSSRKSNTAGFRISRKAKQKKPVISPDTPISPDTLAAERHSMIAEAAYSRAENRGFTSGHEMHDWLEAEKEIDGKLGKAAISATD